MALLSETRLFLEVANLVAKRGIKTLIESGTGPESSGMLVAKRLGLVGYTCDVYEPCCIAANDRFPEFFIYHADSEAMLKRILPSISQPAFFWLDGHCPTDPSCLPAGIFPVMEELQLIKELKPNYEKDVIWVDDILMVVDPANPVSTPWDVRLNVPAMGEANWKGDEHPWADYLAVFADTHDWEIDSDDVKILKLTPKYSPG